MAVGNVGTFDLIKGNWDSYIDRLEQYFIANDVKESVKVATLITVMGSDAYELMVNLCTPIKPSAKTFGELSSIMKSHLQPKPSLLAERYKFRQRVQKNGESVAQYVATLKCLSKDCRFGGDSLMENLRDQFVCGLLNDSIRQRLFTEDEILFNKAFKLAAAMEMAEADAALVEDRARTKGDGVSTAETSVYQQSYSNKRERERTVGRTDSNGNRGSATSSGGPKGARGAMSGRGLNMKQATRFTDRTNVVCTACGEHHNVNSCKFRVYVCRVCNKEGHLKKMCPKLRVGMTTLLHNEEYPSKLENDTSDSDEVNNFSFDCKDFKTYAPYTMNICVDNKCLPMEIDTGSRISCISYECYKNMFSNIALIKSDLKLRYYTGEKVVPVGKFTPLVRHNARSKYLDLYVMDKGETNLLGRQWLEEVGITVPIRSDGLHNVKQQFFDLGEFSSRYFEVFEDGLGRYTGGKVGFHLRPEARPVFLRARPLAYALREPVERALDELVREGIITPVTTSDWATPIVPVMKKDGTIRICGDYKITLNKCLEVDRFPLPRVEDLLAKLHGGENFSKIDLSQAYAQFELDDSKKYTVINTHKGMFMYNRLIYGLSSSPGIFQRKLEQLFSDMPRVGVFLDDVIITGKDSREHLATLNEVFERLKKYGLKVKKDKCVFFTPSVTYLGFVISKEGVHTCPDKIKAIITVAEPSNVSELRSFLGMVMYYAKFVPNISDILAPLYTLLRKDVKFEWSVKCRQAFQCIKDMLVSSDILTHYSPELPLVLTTDASSIGLGAVISHITSQGERPVAFASRVLNSAEKSYSQIEREALAIIYGIKKFHQYLYGRQFTLRTDHKPLVTIFGDKTGIPTMAASRMQRWAVILTGYNYKIEYVRSENNSADALSRLPIGLPPREKTEVTYINFIQKFLPVTRKSVQDQLNKDETLKRVMLFLQSGWPNECLDRDLQPYFTRRHELYIDMGCVIWGYRLVIPDTLRQVLLQELHVGHMGIVKMKSIARSIMWWPGIDGDIERVCKECATCTAESTAPPRAPPQPWPYAPKPWSRLHIDFLGPIQGKTFLVLIDSTTKWLEIFEMAKTTASSVIKILRETFARFGLPKEVVSDNGPPFSSREYADFMNNNGIKITFAAIYHPSSNGAAEGAVKLCKRAIKKSFRDGCELDAALQSYLMAYRNVEHSSTGVTPAMFLQRRNLRSRLDLLRGDRQVDDKVCTSQHRQIHNAGGVPREFKLGDKVWTRNYTDGKKWLAGQIKQKIGSRNYLVGREDGLPEVKRHVDQIRNKWATTLDLPVYTNGTSSPKLVRGVGFHACPKSNIDCPTREGNESTRCGVSGSGSVDAVAPVMSPTVPRRSTRIKKPVVKYGFGLDID